MNVVGIIAEYNPMHNGHIYNIKKAKELSNADFVVVIMSGSFTEQGNIAVIDKFNRAKIAIENGADMVIELPTIYATSSAENFAFGAVNILNSLGIITHLAFGAETEDINSLQEIANVYLTHKEKIISKCKEYTKQGINSGEAYKEAMSEFLGNFNEDFTLPNNILAIEYLKALMALNSQIKPVLVHRLKSNHNEEEISKTSEYASSTSIRNALCNETLNTTQKLSSIKAVVPENTYDHLKNNEYNTNEIMWNNLKYEILKLNVDGLKNIHEINEGLENKIYNEALLCDNYNDFIFSVKSKRYTLSKIKRICVYILLGMTKEKYATLNSVNYARILKVKDSAAILLSEISNKTKNIFLTKITDDILDNLDNTICQSIKLDMLANNLFNKSNTDYTNKIIQP